ncbi:MAG: dynamin family protein [Bryobacteraceae bacterium]
MVSGTVAEDRLGPGDPSDSKGVIQLVADVASHHEISALEPILQVCRSAAARQDLSVAVLGRFNAGKSSFLNHLVGRDVLPVGVIPVTSVITEMLWGPTERAEVHFLDSHTESVPLDSVAEFITELKNPENGKRVSTVCLYLPDLEDYKELRFVDTPGLESVFSHNTESSLAWAPNVDLALVAIGVDPPLAQQDLTLIRKLFKYTPKICVLLTKVDVLTETEHDEVLQFVRKQLKRVFEQQIEVFPYSTRPGFESLRYELREQLIDQTLHTIRDQKRQIVARKLQTLLGECADYLELTLRSATMIDSERQQLQVLAFRERAAIADTKLELQLIARHNTGTARSRVEKILAPYESRVALELAAALEHEYRSWRLSFKGLLERFESWLGEALTARLTEISSAHQSDFLAPVRDVQRQYMRVLQGFRDQLSQRTMKLLGVPLRTTETEIEAEPPKTPDINIGHVFDHNWELLSPIIPVQLFRAVVKRRFLRRVNDETFKNLSRLTAQWTDVIAAAIAQTQQVAQHRLEDFVNTVEYLTASSATRAPQIQTDLERVQRARASLPAERR